MSVVKVDRIDHFVLTVRDIGATCEFYSRVLGMEIEEFDGRWAIKFGQQKINLHQSGNEFEPKADVPTPGSGDFCLITDVLLERVVEHLASCGVVLVEGPVSRTGDLGLMDSVYFRDPDRNLVEVSNYRENGE